MISQAHICCSSYPQDWPPVLLHHHFLRAADHQPNHYAIVCGHENWTYGHFSERAHHYAGALYQAGLRPGDRLIIQSDPCPQALALLAACSIFGVIFVPVSPEAPTEWLTHISESAQPSAIIHQTLDHATWKWQEAPTGGFERDNLCLNGRVPIHGRSRSGPVLESDTAYIIFTSGTTGRPKGIMISHRAVLAFSARWSTTATYLQTTV